MAKVPSKFDFWGSDKMSYDQRTKFGSGDYYGLGQGPKVGKMRSSYMDTFEIGEGKNSNKTPPKKLA